MSIPFALDPGSTDCPDGVFTLAAGESCTLGYVFAPTEPGEVVETVGIASDAAGSPHTLTLSGTGASTGQIVLMPGSVDLGDVEAGGSVASDLFVVENTGSGDAVLGNVEILGAQPGAFSVEDDICSGTVLPAGEMCGFSVRFSPPQPGIFRARVRVPSDAPDSPAEAALLGTSGVLFFDGFESTTP